VSTARGAQAEGLTYHFRNAARPSDVLWQKWTTFAIHCAKNGLQPQRFARPSSGGARVV
jgi:hypothetical protein